MIRVFDAEADGLLDEATQIWCISFRTLDDELDASFGPGQKEEAIKYMKGCTTLIGHNVIGYDFPLMEKIWNYTYTGKVIDTLVLSRMLKPKRVVPVHAKDQRAGPHSLYAWGVRVGIDKPEYDDWKNYTPEMLHRNQEDTRINVAVYHALMEEAKKRGGDWSQAIPMTMKLFHYLFKQEQYGWFIDKEWGEYLIGKLQRRMDRIDRAIAPHLPKVVEIHEQKLKGVWGHVRKPFLKSGDYSASVVNWLSQEELDERLVVGPFARVSFRPVDVNSRDEVVEFLLSSGWEPLEWNTNDNGERTSPKLSKDDPFEGVDGKLGKLIAKRTQTRHRLSLVVGLMKLIREDGRIGGAVNNLADTARATHRNIVNIPKVGSYLGAEIRKMFSSQDGMVLVGTDSDSCQLRMLGARMGSKEYIEALTTGDKAKGTDLHSLTRKVAELESRDIAKNVIYCLLFGGGDPKLGKTAKQVGKGAEIRKRLYKGFDGLEDLVEGLKYEWKKTAKRRYNARFGREEYFDGWITGLDGRPIKVPYEHQLLVYLLQSDEAIMMSAAYIKANIECEKRWTYGKDYGFVCWYHDEYTIECRPEIAEEVKKIAEDAIVWAGNFYKIQCPHVGDGNIGKSWHDIH